MVPPPAPAYQRCVLLLLLLAACRDATPPTDPHLQQLLDMGYRSEDIHSVGDYFIVSGDIKVTRARLDALSERPQGPVPGVSFQWHTYNLVAQANVDTIRVALDPALAESWKTATRSAMTAWNAIDGTIVYFVEGGTANITVSVEPGLPPNQVAVAEFPAGGQPGPTIHVNPLFDSYNEAQKLYVMTHEFGHTFGLRHSNWHLTTPCGGPEPENPWGARHVGPGNGYLDGDGLLGSTPTSDPASVLNRCTGGTEFSAFSEGDLHAVRVLYPHVPVPWTNEQIVGNPIIVTWASIPGATSYHYVFCDLHSTLDQEGNVYYFEACSVGPNGADTVRNFGPSTGRVGCEAYVRIRPVFASGEIGSSPQAGLAVCSEEWDY